jgi:hypothetical protein
VGGNPLRTPKDRRLGRPLPYLPANPTHAHLMPPKFYPDDPCGCQGRWGVNPRFHGLSPCIRQVAYALRTRLPVATRPKSVLPLDLHVLSLPLAFILSQDQTLRCIYKKLNSLLPSDVLIQRNQQSWYTLLLFFVLHHFKELA